MLQNQTKWQPGADFSVSKTPLSNRYVADWEVIERFRLSRARIEWCVEELKEELERNTARSCPLAPETHVNIIVVVLVVVVVVVFFFFTV